MPQIELYENEQIKQIEAFPNYYITSFGRVWSEYSHKFLSLTVNKRQFYNTYQRQYVNLGKHNRFYVHQLVAKAFIPNPYNLPEVDHIDGNGLNNHVENLRWVTHSQNMKNIITKEKIKQNTGYYIEIEDIQTGEKFNGYKEVSEKYRVCEQTVLNHLNNKVKNPRWRRTGKRIRPNI